jgi:hypothetical protein
MGQSMAGEALTGTTPKLLHKSKIKIIDNP